MFWFDRNKLDVLITGILVATNYRRLSIFLEARPGATGGHAGAVPPLMTACAPQTKIVPPKRGLCPEKINWLEATGVQIEAQIGVFCGLTSDFMTSLG